MELHACEVAMEVLLNLCQSVEMVVECKYVLADLLLHFKTWHGMQPYIKSYTVRENVKRLHIVGRPCCKYESWGSQNSLRHGIF